VVCEVGCLVVLPLLLYKLSIHVPVPQDMAILVSKKKRKKTKITKLSKNVTFGDHECRFPAGSEETSRKTLEGTEGKGTPTEGKGITVGTVQRKVVVISHGVVTSIGPRKNFSQTDFTSLEEKERGQRPNKEIIEWDTEGRAQTEGCVC